MASDVGVDQATHPARFQGASGGVKGEGEINERDAMIRWAYDRLFDQFGPQGWWPAETPFEVAVGAILTQAVAWRNVEQAIANLRKAGLLDPNALAEAPEERVGELIRPTRYYRQKAKRIQGFARALVNGHRGNLERMLAGKTADVRSRLLALHGIGKETADSILLYAGGHAIVVVDAYTRRIFHRLGAWEEDVSYDDMQKALTHALPEDVSVYNECHALIVRLGNAFCKAGRPRCDDCPLARQCAFAQDRATDL